ncbi:methionyl-tRNA formyltransferase [Candidatus Uhrbacteria bacterium]|nr:methionyl-tRNA formyltransferase [Candidatus Uhrbacteria bacterium]
MGTPDHAVPFLETLISSGNKPIAIVTQPDRGSGRSLAIEPTPVKTVGASYDIPILQPEHINDTSSITQLFALHPDLFVVVAYGQILKKVVLTLPVYGCINVHFSLLPRHRGASPVEESILSGDTETGVTLIKMDEQLDHGPILAAQSLPIDPQDTTPSLRKKLERIGASLLTDTIQKIFENKLTATPQDERSATHTRRLTRQSGRIDWKKSATEIDRQIRALNPWPSTWTVCNEKRIKILEAFARAGGVNPSDRIGSFRNGTILCGSGAIVPRLIQMEGKRPASMEEFSRGYRSLLTQKCE